MINDLSREFPDHVIGLSDHSVPDGTISAGLVAYAMGARIIEKHFTLDKKQLGNDHYHSMDESDLSQFIKEIGEVHLKLGNIARKVPLESELNSRRYARRSIVASKLIEVGTTLSANNLTVKRPGTGIGSENWYEVIGKIAITQIEEDSQIKFEDLSEGI